MTSLNDCAVLADDVYRDGRNPAGRHGWKLVDLQSWDKGFAAGTYERNGKTVVAFRGTDDSEDIFVANVQMIPLVDKGKAEEVVKVVLEKYGSSDDALLNGSVSKVLEYLLQHPKIRESIRQGANRVPSKQGRLVLSYFKSRRVKPSFVVGHSLGGALAKYVAHETSSHGVAFNSPMMGDLAGMRPLSLPTLLNVNTVGDPLSFATEVAGNLSHGNTISIAIPPKVIRTSAKFTTWQKVLIPDIVEMALWARDQKRLIEDVAQLALYYHSMKNLSDAISRQPRFSVPLAPHFKNV
jgi:hypothetical protein